MLWTDYANSSPFWAAAWRTEPHMGDGLWAIHNATAPEFIRQTLGFEHERQWGQRLLDFRGFFVGARVTPSGSHCNRGRPFEVVSIRWSRRREAVADRFGWPGSPIVPGHWVVAADCLSHPQTIGTAHMTPGGWEVCQ